MQRGGHEDVEVAVANGPVSESLSDRNVGRKFPEELQLYPCEYSTSEDSHRGHRRLNYSCEIACYSKIRQPNIECEGKSNKQGDQSEQKRGGSQHLLPPGLRRKGQLV